MKSIIIGLLISLSVISLKGQTPGTKISLNGVWDFEQTANAFPPETFTRKCPVPGLIHLAEPKIDAFDNLFQTPEKSFLLSNLVTCLQVFLIDTVTTPLVITSLISLFFDFKTYSSFVILNRADVEQVCD